MTTLSVISKDDALRHIHTCLYRVNTLPVQGSTVINKGPVTIKAYIMTTLSVISKDDCLQGCIFVGMRFCLIVFTFRCAITSLPSTRIRTENASIQKLPWVVFFKNASMYTELKVLGWVKENYSMQPLKTKQNAKILPGKGKMLVICIWHDALQQALIRNI